MSEPTTDSSAQELPANPEAAFVAALQAEGDGGGEESDESSDGGEDELETQAPDEEETAEDADPGVETQEQPEEGEGETEAGEPGPIPYSRFREANERSRAEIAALQQQMLQMQQHMLAQQAALQQQEQQRQAQAAQQSQVSLEARAKQILKQQGMDPTNEVAVFAVIGELKRAEVEQQLHELRTQWQQQTQEQQLRQQHQAATAEISAAFSQALAEISVPQRLMAQAVSAGAGFMLQGYTPQQIVPHIIQELGLNELPRKSAKKAAPKADGAALKAIASRGNGSGRTAGSQASGASGPRPGQKVGDYLDEVMKKAFTG